MSQPISQTSMQVSSSLKGSSGHSLASETVPVSYPVTVPKSASVTEPTPVTELVTVPVPVMEPILFL